MSVDLVADSAARVRRQGLRIAFAIAIGFTLAVASGETLPFLAPMFAVQFLVASPGPLAPKQAFGLLVRKPLANVPENTLKFGVGVMLSAFGVFWTCEGLGAPWPGDDWALFGLAGVFLVVALALVALVRPRAAAVAT